MGLNAALDLMWGFPPGASGASAPAPANTEAPAITGTALVGETLAVSDGTWTGEPTSYAYQWNRDGVAIDGATAAAYTLVSADFAAAITATVTATNADGSTAATSAATEAVQISIDFSGLDDGALPALLTGATWAIVSGAAVNTPTTGAPNIVTDGDMEAEGVTIWANAGSPTTKEKSTAQKHGGAQSLHIVGNDATGAQSFPTAVAGQFYELGGWLMNVTGTSARLVFTFAFHTVQLNSDAATWTEVKASDWASATNPRAQIYTIGAAPGEVFADDIYALPYNNATLVFATAEVSPLVTVEADWTIAVNRQAGVDVCIDDPTNPKYFVRGLYDRTTAKVYLLKYVNGVMTALIDGVAVAYSAGATVEVRHPAPNTFQLFYGGTQRGTDQTVSDAGIIANGYHGAFSTGGGSQLDRFFVA